MPATDLTLTDGSQVVPGQFRHCAVAAGRHEAPTAASLPVFLSRWAEVYGGARRGEASLVALAAIHHRLAWTSPFLEGNSHSKAPN